MRCKKELPAKCARTKNMCFYILCHLGDEERSEEAGNLGEGVGDPKQDPRVRAGLQMI